MFKLTRLEIKATKCLRFFFFFTFTTVNSRHINGRPIATSSSGRFHLLLEALQLEDQRVLFCAEALQHGLLLDEGLCQLMESTL